MSKVDDFVEKTETGREGVAYALAALLTQVGVGIDSFTDSATAVGRGLKSTGEKMLRVGKVAALTVFAITIGLVLIVIAGLGMLLVLVPEAQIFLIAWGMLMAVKILYGTPTVLKIYRIGATSVAAIFIFMAVRLVFSQVIDLGSVDWANLEWPDRLTIVRTIPVEVLVREYYETQTEIVHELPPEVLDRLTALEGRMDAVVTRMDEVVALANGAVGNANEAVSYAQNAVGAAGEVYAQSAETTALAERAMLTAGAFLTETRAVRDEMRGWMARVPALKIQQVIYSTLPVTETVVIVSEHPGHDGWSEPLIAGEYLALRSGISQILISPGYKATFYTSVAFGSLNGDKPFKSLVLEAGDYDLVNSESEELRSFNDQLHSVIVELVGEGGIEGDPKR